MKYISQRLERTLERISGLGDCGLMAVASDISGFSKKIERIFLRLKRWRWYLRIVLILLALECGLELVIHASDLPRLSLSVDSWNEVISIGANLTQIAICLIPLLLSALFIERLLERGVLLKVLGALERLNDTVYDEQFDDNPFHTQGGGQKRTQDWLLEYLDSCTGLLLLIRMLAHQVSQHSSDKVVLDRCGIVRRGAGDNHSRILQKITILKLNPLGTAQSSDALIAEQCVAGFAAGFANEKEAHLDDGLTDSHDKCA